MRLLHSGSRNIGKELAERHIAVPRRLPHNADLPDRDLAVFLTGTPEMDAYRRDLYWAQEYARRNRALMMALLCGVVRDVLGKSASTSRSRATTTTSRRRPTAASTCW